MGEGLTSQQLTMLRTLYELAAAQVNTLYDAESAECELALIQTRIREAFPHNWDEAF